MVHTKVVIRTKDDKEPAINLPESTKVIEAELEQFTILEGGMGSGKTSVSFHINLPDGSHVWVQTSATIFNMMHGALTGAEQRFLDLKTKKN